MTTLLQPHCGHLPARSPSHSPSLVLQQARRASAWQHWTDTGNLRCRAAAVEQEAQPAAEADLVASAPHAPGPQWIANSTDGLDTAGDQAEAQQMDAVIKAFVIEDLEGTKYLLTNAHSVEYHAQVKVKRRGDDRKHIARVLAVGVECDMALLTVEEPEFWEGVRAVRFGPLPRLHDPVTVVGYPVGGDTISVTSGVVSRIEVTDYGHGSQLLGIQIDAAINFGNSGGPVFNKAGDCVGIAFARFVDAEATGYAIPPPIINHFLTDFKQHGAFSGFPSLGVTYQTLESPVMRSYFDMADGDKGVLISSVAPQAPAHGKLQRDDVLMRFDGVQIANDGTVSFRIGERIALSFLESMKYTGDSAVVDILRKGKHMQFEVPLWKRSRLVPLHLDGEDPSYLIIGGLVFTVSCEPYLLDEYGHPADAPVLLQADYLHGQQQHAEHEVVLLSKLLSGRDTDGFNGCEDLRVHSFNGTPVRTLKHLAKMVHGCRAAFMRFDLDHNRVVVLDRQRAVSSTPNVLADHLIASDVSKDLRAMSQMKRRRRRRAADRSEKGADTAPSNGAEPPS